MCVCSQTWKYPLLISLSSYYYRKIPTLLTCYFSCTSLPPYRGVARAWGQGYFGQGASRVWLDEVGCTGNELSLEQCPKNDWGEHNCQHNEDAGVSCTPLTGTHTHAHTYTNTRTHTYKHRSLTLPPSRGDS